MNHIKGVKSIKGVNSIKDIKDIKELLIKIRDYEPNIILLIKSFIEEVFKVGDGVIKFNKYLNKITNRNHIYKNYNQFVIIDGRFFQKKRIYYSYSYNCGLSEGYAYGCNLKKLSDEKKKDALLRPHKYPMGMLPF